jgi:hypothetical protein
MRRWHRSGIADHCACKHTGATRAQQRTIACGNNVSAVMEPPRDSRLAAHAACLFAHSVADRPRRASCIRLISVLCLSSLPRLCGPGPALLRIATSSTISFQHALPMYHSFASFRLLP